MDVLGQEVYHQAIINPNNTTINISQLSNGVYFYQLSNSKETLRGKFVKN
jgi:type IX secretion system substrate protein